MIKITHPARFPTFLIFFLIKLTVDWVRRCFYFRRLQQSLAVVPLSCRVTSDWINVSNVVCIRLTSRPSNLVYQSGANWHSVMLSSACVRPAAPRHSQSHLQKRMHINRCGWLQNETPLWTYGEFSRFLFPRPRTLPSIISYLTLLWMRPCFLPDRVLIFLSLLMR